MEESLVIKELDIARNEEVERRPLLNWRNFKHYAFDGYNSKSIPLELVSSSVLEWFDLSKRKGFTVEELGYVTAAYKKLSDVLLYTPNNLLFHNAKTKYFDKNTGTVSLTYCNQYNKFTLEAKLSIVPYFHMADGFEIRYDFTWKDNFYSPNSETPESESKVIKLNHINDTFESPEECFKRSSQLIATYIDRFCKFILIDIYKNRHNKRSKERIEYYLRFNLDKEGVGYRVYDGPSLLKRIFYHIRKIFNI